MIRVILQGRTGNNFFQYATGRALAMRHETSLVLDASWMDRFHADAFRHLLRLPLAAEYERRFTVTKRLGRRLFRIGPGDIHHGPVVSDLSLRKRPDLLEVTDGSLLMGFFQNPAYFSGIETELRRELDLSAISIPDASQAFEEILRSTPTVSLHVRRGDYLGIENTQCIGEDYHERAIAWFRERFENLRFCVFSDDISWCRARFKGAQFLFCEFPTASGDPLHDMRLMSACHHHIIVNSSYSWWGAWLNPSLSKQVIAPKMWMKELSSVSVTPKNWIHA